MPSEVKSGTVTVLTDKDIHAHNTFENPDAVRPRSEDLTVTGSSIRHTFPAGLGNLNTGET